MIAKALSVRAPWWWFILHGGKDIENRDWATGFRGTVYLHASKSYVLRDLDLSLVVILDILEKSATRLEKTLLHDDMKPFCGHIVGMVDVVDCVTRSDSPWFFGEYGFVLANPVAFAKPVRCKGALGFFTVPDDVLAQLAEAA